MTTSITAPHPTHTRSARVQMIRAEIDLNAFQRWAGSRQLIRRNVFDEGFAMHCLLTEVFGECAPKPFRLIAPKRRRVTCGVLYGYGRWDADALREAAAQFADPLQTSALPAESICAKPMPTQWQPGQRLGFETLVRPVVRAPKRSGVCGGEMDAFQREAERHPPGGMKRTRHDVYADWLRDQLHRHGQAELEDVSLHSFQRTRAVRALRGTPVEGPSAVMRGTLSITDPTEFQRLIERGIGRHRSYGYGMLLLRPPGRRAT